MTTEPLYYLETQLRQLCKTSNDGPRLIVEMLTGIPELRDPVRNLRVEEIEELEDSVSKLEDELTEADEKVESLENHLADAEKKIDDLEKEVEDLGYALLEAGESR